MGKLIFFVCFIVTGFFAGAQDTAFIKKSHIIEGSFTDFNVDNIGNIYVVINNEQLKKLTASGDSVAVFNELKRYGKITSVDVSNPFKILLYFKEASTIVIVDRLLSIRQVIDLRKSRLQQVNTIRFSYDNNIWLYDELETKIKKIDDNGKLLMESADLRTVLGELPSFQNIFDDNKFLYLYDPKLGWYLFDHYGTFSRSFSYPGWKDPQVVNGYMTGRKDSTLLFFKPGTFAFESVQLPIPVNGILKLQQYPGHTYVLYPGKLEIYDAP